MSVALHHVDLALKLLIRHSLHLTQALLDIGHVSVISSVLSWGLWSWCCLLLLLFLYNRLFSFLGLRRLLLLCRFSPFFFWISNNDSSQSFLRWLTFLLSNRCRFLLLLCRSLFLLLFGFCFRFFSSQLICRIFSLRSLVDIILSFDLIVELPQLLIIRRAYTGFFSIVMNTSDASFGSWFCAFVAGLVHSSGQSEACLVVAGMAVEYSLALVDGGVVFFVIYFAKSDVQPCLRFKLLTG